MSEKHPIEFKLFAPYNEEVAVIGEWNEWKPQPMEKGPDGWWRKNIKLADGKYQYKFRVKSKTFYQEGETVDIADPRAVRVSRDEHENAYVYIENGKHVFINYEWQHEDVPLAANRELVIYEMHIQDFIGSDLTDEKSVFQQAIDKLDYLRDLGINAVELMPVNDYPGDYSWGYNPRFPFAVENNYGTPDDFAQFVDECHARGIRVILDVVFNHSEDANPLADIDHTYWFHGENPDDAAFHWGTKLNFEFYDENMNIYPAREHVKDVILHWIHTFQIDGLRFDATAILDNFDALHYWNQAIYQAVGDIKPFITIAEHVPQDPAVTGYDGPLDAAWHESFSKQLQSITVGVSIAYREPNDLNELLTSMQPTKEGYTSPINVVNYIDNHDQERIMWLLGEGGGFFDDEAFKRQKMAAAVLLTAPGIPMLWMGQEFGVASESGIEPHPMDWTLLQNDRNADLRNYYYGLVHLRTGTSALQSNNIEILHADAERMFTVYRRWDDEGGQVIVAANLGGQYNSFEVAAAGGDWHEYVFDYTVSADGDCLRDEVAEHQVKVYLKS